jgi:hypothetical protein
LKKLALVGLAGALAAVGIAAPSIAGGNKYGDSNPSFTCQDATGADAGTVELVGPLKLWPPNHKFVDEPVTVTDDSGDDVTLTLTPVVTDATGGDGGSQHDPDFNATSEDGKTLFAEGTGSATAALQLRAERSGKGEGRTYTINWDATMDNGATSCHSSDQGKAPFVIEVPHDMGGGADWK